MCFSLISFVLIGRIDVGDLLVKRGEFNEGEKDYSQKFVNRR